MIVFRFQNKNRYINKCLGYYYIEVKNTCVPLIQSLSFPNIIRDKLAIVAKCFNTCIGCFITVRRNNTL